MFLNHNGTSTCMRIVGELSEDDSDDDDDEEGDSDMGAEEFEQQEKAKLEREKEEIMNDKTLIAEVWLVAGPLKTSSVICSLHFITRIIYFEIC